MNLLHLLNLPALLLFHFYFIATNKFIQIFGFHIAFLDLKIKSYTLNLYLLLLIYPLYQILQIIYKIIVTIFPLYYCAKLILGCTNGLNFLYLHLIFLYIPKSR